MKDTAPKGLGIAAVSALFGFVAAVMAYVVMNFSGFSSVVIGVIVALIAAIVLWLGWREPAAGPSGPRDLSPGANGADNGVSSSGAGSTGGAAAATAAAATVTAAAMSSGSTTAAPVASAPAAAKPAAKPAAKAAKPAAKASKPAAKAAKPAAKAAKPAAKAARPVAADGKPETLTAARAGGADDLKQIKGVGPQLEGVLNDLGFYHFDQVASWRKAEVEWVDSRLKFKGRIVRDEWIKQAKKLAKGEATEFSKKVKKGGVY